MLLTSGAFCRSGLVALANFAFGACAPAAPSADGRASVIDGDTLEIHGQRIRLWGVDAPETRQTCAVDRRAERCGRVAAERLASHLTDQVVVCVERDVDRYGRSVATCRVDGDDIGAWLVREGLAVRYARYAGWTYLIEEADARHAARGIWRGSFDNPEDWRREHRNSGR